MNNQQHSQLQQNEGSADEDEAGQPQQAETETGEESAVNNTSTVEGQDESADPFSDVYDNSNEDANPSTDGYDDDGNEDTDLYSADGEGNGKQKPLNLSSWPLEISKMSSLESKLDGAHLETLDSGLDEMSKDEREKLAVNKRSNKMKVLKAVRDKLPLDKAYLEELHSGPYDMAEDERDKLALSKDVLITLDKAHLELDSGTYTMTDCGHFETLILLGKVLLKRLASKELYSGPYEMAEDERDKLALSKDDSLALDHVLLKGPDSESYEMTNSGHFKTLKDVLILLCKVLLKRLASKELYSGPYEIAEDERDKVALGKDDSLALDHVLLKGPDSEPYEMTEDEREELALSKDDANALDYALLKGLDSESYAMTDSGHFKTLKDVLILLCKVLLKRLASKELYSGPYEMAEDARDKVALGKDDSLALDHVLLKGPDSEPYEMTEDERAELALSKDDANALDYALLKGLDSESYAMTDSGHFKTLKDVLILLCKVLLKRLASKELYSGPYEMAEDERDKVALGKDDSLALDHVLLKGPDSEPYEMTVDEREELALSKDDANALDYALLKGLDSESYAMTDSGHFKTLKDVLILLCKVLLKRLASKELYSGPYEMAEDKRDKLAFSKDDSLTLDHVLLKGPDSEPYAMTDSGHFKTLKDALILLGNVLLKRLPLKELYSGPYEMAEDERDKLALGKDDSLALDPVLLKGPDSEPYEMTEDERDKLALSKYDLNPLEDVLWKEPDSEPYEMLEDERDILALSKDDSTALGDILLKGLDSGINEMPEVQNSAPLEILEDATDRLALCSLDTPPLEIQDSRHFEIPSLQTVDNDNQDIYHTDHQAHQQDTQLHNEVPLEGLPYQEDVDVTLYHDLHPSDILFFSIQVVDDDDQDIPHPDNGAHEEGTQLHIEVPLEGLLNQWQLQGFDDNTSYQDLHPREMPHQQDMQLDLYQDLHPENTR